jgi:hypothetical protein
VRTLLLIVLILFPVILIGWIAMHRFERAPAEQPLAAASQPVLAPQSQHGSVPALAASAPTSAPASAPASSLVVASAPASAPVAASKPAVAPKPAALDEDGKLRALFKLPLAGVKIDGQVKLYDQQGLFDYIDGAAPIFIERNFRKLAAADLLAGDGSLTCDIYDMRSADNAASIYTKEKSPTATAVAIGDQAHQGSMSLVFRRDRYYVKLTAFDKTAEALLPELARALVGRM